MKWKETEFQGKKVKYHSQKVGNTTWYHVEGETYTIVSAPKKKNRKQGQAEASDSIFAPMPGKVTKILKQNLQLVAKGEAVIVMEAMKMEYTLKADLDSSIEQILVSVGQQVALGEALVKFKSKDASNV